MVRLSSFYFLSESNSINSIESLVSMITSLQLNRFCCCCCCCCCVWVWVYSLNSPCHFLYLGMAFEGLFFLILVVVVLYSGDWGCAIRSFYSLFNVKRLSIAHEIEDRQRWRWRQRRRRANDDYKAVSSSSSSAFLFFFDLL